MIPRIQLGTTIVSLDDIDVIEVLCRARESKNEYVVMEDVNSRNLLMKDGYLKVDLENGHCWSTAKLRNQVKGIRKTLEKQTYEEMKKKPKDLSDRSITELAHEVIHGCS